MKLFTDSIRVYFIFNIPTFRTLYSDRGHGVDWDVGRPNYENCDMYRHITNYYIILKIYKYIITSFPLRGKQRYIIEWYSMYPLYARRFMLNVIGDAQPIAVLRALTHLILTCGFPHDVFLHRMSSRYLLYISFLKTHWYTATTGIRTGDLSKSKSAVRPPSHRHLILKIVSFQLCSKSRIHKKPICIVRQSELRHYKLT